MTHSVVAIDLGATSGRVIEGWVTPTSLEHTVIHRFPNGPVKDGESLRWNVTGLFDEVVRGMSLIGQSAQDIVSVGVDSWAVDYGLLAQGKLLHEPFHYRDARTNRGVVVVHERADHAKLFAKNGLQFLPFNSIYQLATEDWSGESASADALLLVPDLINYWLTGESFMERTNASTTGLVNVATGELDSELLALGGAPRALFAPLIDAGAIVGSLTPSVAGVVGFSAPVVAVGSHDTASAVVAAPLSDSSSAYVSLGTWGLVGVETSRPIVTEAAREANFTNEGGVDGRNRFLHNVMGLWLLNESVNFWKSRGESRGLADLLAQASEVPPGSHAFDVDDPVFMAPGDIPVRIAQWYEDRGVPLSSDPVVVVAQIVDSLALAIATTVQKAGELAGITVTEISVVGGGAHNSLLNQRLANQAGIPVVAGPAEATALGNILVQARTAGLVRGDLDSLRGLVRSATNLVTYRPSSMHFR